MKRDYSLYLKDIIAAFDSIEDFVKGLDLEGFIADDKTSNSSHKKV